MLKTDFRNLVVRGSRMKEEEGRRYKQEIKEVRARGGTSKRI